MNNIIDIRKFNVLKGIYRLAYKSEYEIVSFINAFSSSSFMIELDIGITSLQYVDYHSFYYDFVNENVNSLIKTKNNQQSISLEVVDYIAFIYIRYFEITGELTKVTNKLLPIKDIISNFDYYHTQNEQQVIYYSKMRFNKNNNEKRRQRGKNNLPIDYNSPLLIFIFKTIYLKLFYYTSIDQLVYKADLNFSYLCDNTTFFFGKHVKDIDEMTSLLNKNDLIEYTYKYDNSIVFIALDSLKEDIILLTKLLSKINANYQEIILLYNNTIYFYKQFEGVTKLYFTYTKVDFKKAKNDYQKRFN